MLTRLYQWMLAKAAHRHAERWLFAFSFMESSFFPIPPHPLLGLMCLARPERAPLEARLALASPAAFAHQLVASPLPSVLAARSRANEADGLVVASADGLWLQLGGRH